MTTTRVIIVIHVLYDCDYYCHGEYGWRLALRLVVLIPRAIVFVLRFVIVIRIGLLLLWLRRRALRALRTTTTLTLRMLSSANNRITDAATIMTTSTNKMTSSKISTITTIITIRSAMRIICMITSTSMLRVWRLRLRPLQPLWYGREWTRPGATTTDPNCRNGTTATQHHTDHQSSACFFRYPKTQSKGCQRRPNTFGARRWSP